VVTLNLVNPHGDVVAAVADDPGAIGPSSYVECTEYGAPRDASAAYTDHGWLGGSRRSSDALGGVVLMGVRLYNAATGLFLSADPIPGVRDGLRIRRRRLFPAAPATRTLTPALTRQPA
jgi:hypothetical protein